MLRTIVAGAGDFRAAREETGAAVSLDAIRSRSKRLRHADRVTLLSIAAAAEAFSDAGMGPDAPERDRAGIHLGNSYGAFETNISHQKTVSTQGGALSSPAVFSYTLPNVPAGWVSIMERVRGPLLTFASGTLAAADAFASALLKLGAGDEPGVALAGATRSCVAQADAALEKARGAVSAVQAEYSAFLVLRSQPDPAPGSVEIVFSKTARAGGCPDPLQALLGAAEAGCQAIVAGDATRDRETAIRLEAAGFNVAAAVSAVFGDVGEAAPAAGAVLAYRWMKGSWSPPSKRSSPGSVLVAGLDACGRRAFAFLFRRV